MATVRTRVIVSGEVQGVWFRESTRREAEAREVAGRVWNRSDGMVEAVFEGDRDAVSELVDWCRTGPPRAEVTGVDVSEEPVEGLSDFRVED